MRPITASKALAKYKVLDLTRARAGPTAARQLADWGAQVIKIEMPGSDDTLEGSPQRGQSGSANPGRARSLCRASPQPNRLGEFSREPMA